VHNYREKCLMSEFTATVRRQITIDVTDWPSHEERQLIEVIRRFEATLTKPDLEDVEATGWTEEAFASAVAAVHAARGTVQAKVILRAVENGGTVTREEVYEIGGYPADRSLKGFTRPVNRVTQQMRDRGDLPEDAEELLQPHYSEDARGYSRATGFRVPLELVVLYRNKQG